MTPKEKKQALCWLDTYFPDLKFNELEVARLAKCLRGEFPPVGPDGKYTFPRLED